MKKSVRLIHQSGENLLRMFPNSKYRKPADILMAVYMAEARITCYPERLDFFAENSKELNIKEMLRSDNVYCAFENGNAAIYSDIELNQKEMSEERYIHHSNSIEQIILRGTSGYDIAMKIMVYIDSNFVERSDA